MNRIIAIAILAILLAVSLWGNWHQHSKLASARADYEAHLAQAANANKAQSKALKAVQADRDECQRRLTKQKHSAAELRKHQHGINAAVQARMAKMHAKLLQMRATPACKTWAEKPACGVGQWDE